MDTESQSPSLKSSVSEAVGLARSTIGISVAIATVAVLLSVVGALVSGGKLSGEKEFAGTFARVTVGMPRDEILQMLGEPDGQTAELYLGKRKGFEAAYQAAAASASNYFLVWRRESVYSIGFTRQDRVAFKASDGTGLQQ